jgi:hypothetical protein
MKLQSILLTCAVLAGSADEAKADLVTDWNNIIVTSALTDTGGNPRQSRHMAMAHAAMFDAMNAIRPEYEPAMVQINGKGYASREAAGAQAAYEVLVALFPARKALLDADLAASLAQVPENTKKEKKAKAEGIAIGKQAAAAVLAARANDGAFVVAPPYVQQPAAPGVYQFTPGCTPTNLAARQWPGVTPFTAANAPVEPAPALDSQEWLDSLAEVRDFGSNNSTVRTAEQTEIALFYIEASHSSMNRLARTLANQEPAETKKNKAAKQLLNHARLFAALNLAQADAWRYTFTVKYGENFWRPYTAINSMFPGSNWVPLRQTPCHPEYTAGHGTLTGTGTGVLQAFFGDAINVTATSTSLVGVNRNYTSLDQVSNDVNSARVYAGFHYRITNERSKQAGRTIAKFVTDNLMQPLDDDCDDDSDSDSDSD